MRKQTRSFSLLIVVALAAAALTLLFSGATAALPAAQDSPLLPTVTPPATATITPFVTPDVAAPTTFPEPERPLPVETFPPLEAPTSVPLPPAALPTPTVSGFLPAPTITNPEEVQSLPLAQPPVSGGGGSETFPTATPRPPRNPALVASVAILNVLWLICGSVLVVGGVVFIIALARRKSDA